MSSSGIPWIIRKAIFWATITGRLTQNKFEGLTHISIEKTATGGIRGETETHRLDGSECSHGSAMFGTQLVRSSWLCLPAEDKTTVTTPSAIDEYLLEGWLQEEPAGAPGHIHVSVVNKKARWQAQQVWGFATVEGQRRFVKKFVVTRGDEAARVRIVYDWLP